MAENALIDAEQTADSIGRKFVDADIAQFHELGVDLALGATLWVKRYEGTNSFILDLQKRLSRYRQLTSAQARAALNVMRDEKGHATEEKAPNGISCFQCPFVAVSWDELMTHKKEEHGSKQEAPPVVAEKGEAQAVIANTKAVKGLDLSNLPDGRYAAPDISGNNDYIFLMVKRVRRTHNRDRRFVWGKVRTGNEVVVAGTIEVKLWSSDSKELVGEQKPGDVYRGDLEDSLELILLAPEALATLFGKLVGHCCVCGKTLTDDVSRAIGMGLDCEKKEGYFKKPPKYTFIGKDRPDQEKVDPNDEKYLTGQWTNYREPPKVQPSVMGGSR